MIENRKSLLCEIVLCIGPDSVPRQLPFLAGVLLSRSLPCAREKPEMHAIKRENGSWLVDGITPVFEFKELLDIRELPGDSRRFCHFPTRTHSRGG